MATLPVAIDARGARTGAAQADAAFGVVSRGARRATGEVRALAAGFAALTAIRQATAVISEFEATLATLQGVTGLGGTSAALRELESTARAMGATTKFSASEAADGLLFLSRAGFSAEESIQALPATLNLAAAGAIGLGEAADFASNILAQFGLQAGETARVADVLVQAANNANTDVRQLAEALKFVGPVAGSLDKDIEQTAAAIGALGDAGIQASLAGTNLRGIFAGLLGPTTEAQRTLDDLQISLSDIDPATNDIVDIFEEFADAGLTAADAVDIFGRRNAAAAIILATSTDSISELTEKLEGAGGVAELNARIINDTLRGSLLSLRSASEELILSLGDAGLGSALREVTDLAVEVVRSLAGIKVEGESTSAVAEVLSFSIETVATALAAMGIGAAVRALGTLAAAFGTVTGAATALELVLIRNPFLVAAGAIGVTLTALGRYASSVREITRQNLMAAESQSAFNREIESFNRLSAQRARFIELGDVVGEIDTIESQIDRLQDLSVTLREAIEGDDRVEFGTVGELQDLIENVGQVGEIADFAAGQYQEAVDRINQANQGLSSDVFDFSTAPSEQIGQLPVPDFGDFISQVQLSAQQVVPALEQEITRLRDRTRELISEARESGIDRFGNDLDEVAGSASRASEQFAAARQTVSDFIQNLEFQRELIGRTRDEQEQLTVAREAYRLALEAGLPFAIAFSEAVKNEVAVQQELQSEFDESVQGAREFATALSEVTGAMASLGASAAQGLQSGISALASFASAQQDVVASGRSILENVRFERSLVGLNNQERERAITLRRFETLAAQDQTGTLHELTATLESELDALHQAEQLAFTADRIGEAFGRNFEDMLLRIREVQDALSLLFLEVQRAVLNQFVTQPLGNLVSDLTGSLLNFSAGATSTPSGPPFVPTTGAFGLGISKSPVTMAFGGGVVSSPTTIQVAQNQAATVGEATDELVLPAAQTRRGLGVSVADADKLRPNVTFVQNVSTPDVRGFRRSRRQLAEDARRSFT